MALGFPRKVAGIQFLTALCRVELNHAPVPHPEIRRLPGVVLQTDGVVPRIKRLRIEVDGLQRRHTFHHRSGAVEVSEPISLGQVFHENPAFTGDEGIECRARMLRATCLHYGSGFRTLGMQCPFGQTGAEQQQAGNESVHLIGFHLSNPHKAGGVARK